MQWPREPPRTSPCSTMKAIRCRCERDRSSSWRKGFRLVIPRGVPWRIAGKASLTFAGFQTFVGEVVPTSGASLFKAERSLPEHPSTRDTKQVLQPSEDTRRKAWARLEYEAQRRGQPIPTPPVELPAPTRLAKLRQARVASDKPITGLTAEHGNRTT